MIIDVKLRGQILTLPQTSVVLAEGAVNTVRFQLDTDEEWADMGITATFRSVSELGDEIKRDVFVYNKAVSFPVPPEVLRSGFLYIGCTGTAESGTLILTTKTLDRPLRVWTAEKLAEEWAQVLTPELSAQILSVLGDVSKLDTAAKNNLVAAINECYGKNPTQTIIASAYSLNGSSYVAMDDRLPTVVPGSSGAHVGKGAQLIFIPDTTNINDAPTLQMNGGAVVPIRRRSAEGRLVDEKLDATLPIEAGTLIRGVPYAMTFCGLYWLLDSYVPLDGGGGGVDETQLREAVNTALQKAKESGEFDGKDGTDGKDGANGKDGADGKTPVKGVDYFTPEDVASVVQQVLDSLGGVPIFGMVDGNNVITLSGNLAEGVYTLKYEDAEGNVTEIGTLNHSNAPEVTYTNLFVPGTASMNTRMSGSSSASKAQDGYVMSAEISLPAPVTVTDAYDETVPFVLVPDAMWASSANIFGRDSNGQLSVFMDAGQTPGTTVGTWRKIHLRNQFGTSQTISSLIVSLCVKGSAISASDIQNIEIYYNEIPE